MTHAFPIRPELGSVCRFLRAPGRPRLVRSQSRPPLVGVLADLADSRGRH
jgi:hypothetical protein